MHALRIDTDDPVEVVGPKSSDDDVIHIEDARRCVEIIHLNPHRRS